MASIVLSAAGTAIGGALGGPIGAAIGGTLGSAIGGEIDASIFGRPHVEGPRLRDLEVQTSTYGRMIPVLYGTARMAGNVIWSQPIKETSRTETVGGKGGGGGVDRTEYSYSITLAIAICEGKIDSLDRVWADSELLDVSQGTYRVYNGTETQLPDPVIEAEQGVGSTPAFRGLAYVVIEDFPLGNYGNRIPNFTFEVTRRLKTSDIDNTPVEDRISGVTLIPGSGEFVYDTLVQEKVPAVLLSGGNFAPNGEGEPINSHTHQGGANVLLSLDQLAETLPNLEWVSVVVTWFGNSLDAGSCIIQPGVEFNVGAVVQPKQWKVGTIERGSAYLISQDANGNPTYGGTPDDTSLIRLLQELKARGYKVMLLPMFFMDMPGKPWRGRVTGTPADVSSFFSKAQGYNDFINHYATLTKNDIDAFAIGSELKGLTSVTSGAGVYPAVTQLVALAAYVKTIFPASVNVTYAADWSEYHHTDGGWYHMDPLWASPNIDMIGIDAYFPLTDADQGSITLQDVIDGWSSGEGYDYIYPTAARITQTPIAPEYAWKNIEWWWSNNHTNPDMTTTAWVPQSKKIWFTEYGFPSVDGATNQPNVFYDPDSSDGGLPRHSRGQIDFAAQRLGLAATEHVWDASAMVEQKFVWTWDARPYPYYPDLRSVWTDGNLWQFGHWITGKLGQSGLGEIVRELCERGGVDSPHINTKRLTERVDGFALLSPTTPRQAIGWLQQAFYFDLIQQGGQLVGVPRGNAVSDIIAEDDLVPRPNGDNISSFSLTRQQQAELPKEVRVAFYDKFRQYQTSTLYARRDHVQTAQEASIINLPIVMNNSQARRAAYHQLYDRWAGRQRWSFTLPIKHLAIEPGDVISLERADSTHSMRVQAISFGQPGMVDIQAVEEEQTLFEPLETQNDDGTNEALVVPATPTDLRLLDLPALPGDNVYSPSIRVATQGSTNNWPGAALFLSTDGGQDYQRLATLTQAAIMGQAVTALGTSSVTNRVDEVGSVDVAIWGAGTVESVANEAALLNGANAALLGEEVIQFRTATLQADGSYRLSGLLRGRLGTEHAMGSHIMLEPFTLLDSRLLRYELPENALGVARLYRAVTLGQSLNSATDVAQTYSGTMLKPLSPVHVHGTRDGAGNLSIGWVRRTRGGGNWRDFVDVPLNEAFERYEVDILDGATVLRTLTSTSPTLDYSAADQTTDFGSPQAVVAVRIYQLSEAIGRGYGAEASL